MISRRIGVILNLSEPSVLPEPNRVPWSLHSPPLLDDGFSLLSSKLQRLHPHSQEVTLLLISLRK